MPRILVVSDNGQPSVEITIDDEEGNAFGSCGASDWSTGDDPSNDLRDAVEAAGLHLDYKH